MEPTLLNLIFQLLVAASPVIVAISAAVSAIAAILIWRGNKLTREAIDRWSRTLVQPRIFVYGSSRDSRQEIGTGQHKLTDMQISKGGIFVENIDPDFT